MRLDNTNHHNSVTLPAAARGICALRARASPPVKSLRHQTLYVHFLWQFSTHKCSLHGLEWRRRRWRWYKLRFTRAQRVRACVCIYSARRSEVLCVGLSNLLTASRRRTLIPFRPQMRAKTVTNLWILATVTRTRLSQRRRTRGLCGCCQPSFKSNAKAAAEWRQIKCEEEVRNSCKWHAQHWQ